MTTYRFLRIQLTPQVYDVEVSVSEEGANEEWVLINIKFTFPYDADETLGQIEEKAIALAKSTVPKIYHPVA